MSLQVSQSETAPLIKSNYRVQSICTKPKPQIILCILSVNKCLLWHYYGHNWLGFSQHFINNLKLNNAKSQELIVHLLQRRRQFAYLTDTISEIKCAEKMNIRGVTLSDTLTLNNQVTILVEKSARSLYVLKTICLPGLVGNASLDVTRATSVTQLLDGELLSRRKKVSN